MPPKKLSDSDKQDILYQYRNSDETTVTLAVQYNVSTSTISRFLKQYLAESEYEALVQKKRSGGRTQADQETLPGLALPAKLAKPIALVELQPNSARDLEAPEAADLELFDQQPELNQLQRRQRKRTALGSISAEQLAASAAHLSQLEQAPLGRELSDQALADFEQPDFEADDLDLDDLDADDLDADELDLDEPDPDELDPDELEELPKATRPKPALPAPKLARPLPVPKAAIFEDEDDLDDDEDDLDDDEDDLDDEVDGDDEADGDEFDDEADAMVLQPAGQLQILPLQETTLPRTCYIVVDRASELITRPLKEFAELGQTSQEQEKTLPIFDNHRVAKRFLRRMQRIVKVPDGRVFEKVKPYLQAKGITHLLIDGQIYSLQ